MRKRCYVCYLENNIGNSSKVNVALEKMFLYKLKIIRYVDFVNTYISTYKSQHSDELKVTLKI